MAKRVTGWKCLLTIAIFVCNASFAAQDSSKAATSTPPAASVSIPDTTKKSAIAQNPSTVTPAAPAKAAAPQTLQQKKKTAGEDILDEEDLLLPEKGAETPVKPGTSVSRSSSKATGNEQGKSAQAVQDTIRPSADSSASKQAAQPSVAPAVAPPANAAPAAAAIAKPEKPAVAAKIEDARPINFARNLKDFRSPKLAMLLSLVIPGLGQAYIGKGSNYVKAGVYVAVEAAIIGVGAYYFNKGDAKYGQARNYANSYYSFDSMQTYYSQLFNFFITDPHANMDSGSAQGKLNDIYIDTLTDSTSTFVRSYNKNHPTQDYYHTIENSEYVHGWKGCEPSLDDIGKVAAGDTISSSAYRYNYQRGADSVSYLVNLIDKKTGKSVPGSENQLQYGYSPYQREYVGMMNQSNSFYKTATYVLFALILNHVVSAVDALISAKAFDDELLGKQTLWQNLSVQPTTAFSGTTLSPGLTMRLHF